VGSFGYMDVALCARYNANIARRGNFFARRTTLALEMRREKTKAERGKRKISVRPVSTLSEVGKKN
jgi:hypothetical protein